MKVWVTRSQPGGDATAQRLRDLGHAPMIAPLLTVDAFAVEIDLTGVVALAFTSANAARAFAAQEPRRDLPVWAVGGVTAQAARDAGFDSVKSSNGDVALLGAAMAAEMPRGALVLNPCAVDVAGDLATPLTDAGIDLRRLPLYRTAERGIDAALLAALSQASVVLLHSPKAARALSRLLQRYSTSIQRALCLSEAVARALDGGKIPTVSSAALPNDTALLKLL